MLGRVHAGATAGYRTGQLILIPMETKKDG